MTIRDIVKARAEEKGLTAYAVAKLVEGSISPRQVYAFFSGSSDLTSEKLDAMLAALDLEVVPKRKAKKPKREKPL